jgi:hypothetical protein
MPRFLLTLLLALLAGVGSRGADAQAGGGITAQADSMTAFAKAWVAVNEIRDRAHAELANPRNKKVEDQARLREEMRRDIGIALKMHGFTQPRFDQFTVLVSRDDALRKVFDALVAELSAKKPPSGGREAP